MNVLDKLLFNLQTIAGIPRGRRISTAKEFIILDEDSIFQPLWRRAAADGRDKTVREICRIVRTTITLSNYIMESRYIFGSDSIESVDLQKRSVRICELKKIRESLSESVRGIDNICETYSEDADVIGNLRPIIEEIDAHVSVIIKFLSRIDKNNDENN